MRMDGSLSPDSQFVPALLGRCFVHRQGEGRPSTRPCLRESFLGLVLLPADWRRSPPRVHHQPSSQSRSRRVQLRQTCPPPVHPCPPTAQPFDARWRVVARRRLSTDLLRRGNPALCELSWFYSLQQYSGEA